MKAIQPKQTYSNKGFTLIELLVVITIIATLAVVVFVALNPAERLRDARDSKRTADVDSILTAIHQSIVDNKGALPTNLPLAGTERLIGTGDNTVPQCGNAVATGGCNHPAATACADLMSGAINLSTYLQSMPIDPTGGTTWTGVRTGYAVTTDANGIVTVKACGLEGTTNIASSR